MKKKRIIPIVVVIIVLGALIYPKLDFSDNAKKKNVSTNSKSAALNVEGKIILPSPLQNKILLTEH